MCLAEALLRIPDTTTRDALIRDKIGGGDWAPERIVGAREVRGWGGEVHSIPFLHQASTTGLLERIRR